MNRRSILGMVVGFPVIFILAVAPPAQARNSAKFKMLSIGGGMTGSRDVVYDPLPFTSCSYTQTEQISFHSTKPITAYAFSSKAHGSSRVAWSTKPSFSGNLVELEVPGEVTVSRSASYQQVNYVDPETGEVFYGCRHEVHLDGAPASDCTVERSFPVTLRVGGTSDSNESTYVYPDIEPRDLQALDDACEVGFSPTTDAPGLFSRADLFNKKRKRLSDTDRKEDVAFDNATDDQTVTGTIVDELKAKLKRLKSG